MQELAERAVRAALAAGADYADARLVRVAEEVLCLRNGALVEAAAPAEFGLGVRALVQGAFGFSAAPGTAQELADLAKGVARRAARTARDLAAAQRRRVHLAPTPRRMGEYETPVRENPFQVPLEEKLALLAEVDAELTSRPGLVRREVRLEMRRAEQWLATSDGGAGHQILVRSGAGMLAEAHDRGRTERRTYPCAGGDHHAGGFEVVRAYRLAQEAPRVRDEALAACAAPPCPTGRRTLILGTAQLARLIHETIGQSTEADAVGGGGHELGEGSIFELDEVGRARVGSPLVHLYADPEEPLGLATRMLDDEGSVGERFDLVRAGVLVGLSTTREWAQRRTERGEAASRGASGAGQAVQVQAASSRAAARADGWFSPPLVRMSNVSLAPGAGTLAELLADTEDGAILAAGVLSCSVDGRGELRFTCELGYELRGGRPARLVRRPTFRATVAELWAACDRIAGPSEWRLHGVKDCGKGEPVQLVETSHGAAPARFRSLELTAPAGD